MPAGRALGRVSDDVARKADGENDQLQPCVGNMVTHNTSVPLRRTVMPRLRTRSTIDAQGFSLRNRLPEGQGSQQASLRRTAKGFAERLATGTEWRAYVAQLPQLRSRPESNLLATALERYQQYCQVAGMPALDQVSRAVQLRLLLEIYGLASRQCREVLAARRRFNQLQQGGLLAGAADVLNSKHPAAYGDELYAAACSELAHGISKHCQTYYHVPDLGRLAKSQLISMDEHGAKVDRNVAGRLIYLTDEQSLQHRVTIRGGKLYVEGPTGLEPLDTTAMVVGGGNKAHSGKEKNNYDANAGNFGTSLGVVGFAMTLNRDLFVHGGHSVRGYDNAAFSFYHSSYVSGADVVCTGCLTVVNGTLTYINNRSGHYKPPPAQVQIVLESLAVRGVDISQVVVEYSTKHGDDVQHAPMFLQLQYPDPGRAAAPRTTALRNWVSAVGQAYVDDVKRIVDAYDREKTGFRGYKFRRKSAESKAVCAYFKSFYETGKPDANSLYSIVSLLAGTLDPGFRPQVEQMAANFGSREPLPAGLKPGATLTNRLVESAERYHQTLRGV